MPTKIKTQNLLSGVISDAIPSSGDFTVTLSQAPTYTKGFIVFDVTSASSYESVYFHNRVGNVIYVKAENRPSPKAHSIGTSFQMNNTAELINYLSDNVDTFGYVEKTGGLTISVWGGNIYDSGTRYLVSDTSLTLPASQTNYIYLDTGTRTIKQTLVLETADTGLLLATVVSGASSISSISQEQPFVISGPAGDMDSATYDPANVAEQLVGINAVQEVSNKSFTNTNHITLDTTPTSVPTTEGTMSWNTDEETVDLNCGATSLQLGQEIVWNCRNNSGASIADGSVVYATGTIGNSGRITIGKFIADGSIPSYYSLGVATETISNGADGKVTHFGKVRGINTTGASVGETWVDGDLLYASPTTAGAFTKVRPEGLNQRILMAMVIHAHSNGTLAVRIPTQKQFTKAIVTVGRDEDSDYICDGVADNVQIQQAIDAVTTNGGTILIKKGTYNFSNNIQLKSNVRLIGEGTGTILKAGGSHGGIIYQGDTIVPINASVESMTLDVNNIFNVSAVQIYKFDKVTFRDVYVTNVNNIWAFKLGDYGADPAVAKSYALAMYNVRIENSNSGTREPIITVNTDNIILNGVVVKGCDLTNASYVSIFLLSKNVKITNCHFESATDDYGLLDLTGAENVTVTGNTFIHTGSTGGNAIVNRNTNNVTITGNILSGKIGGGAGVIVLDWSGTIDGHTNPFPYTENLVISNNVFNAFYYGLNFSNSDASTNCGWSNVTIANNQFTGFDYSFLTTRHVSGRNSARWNIVGNNVIPRSAGDKILMWFRATGSFQNTKLVIDGNSFNPTSANNTTVFQFDKADIVRFGVNYTEARGTGTVYNLGTSTNVTYTTLSATP